MKNIILIFTLLFAGCIAIPYPHQAVPNSNITGKVIDADSGVPVKDINVRLEFAGLSTKTNEAGSFQFVAKKRWYYFIVIPLLPIDQFSRNDMIVFYDSDNARRKTNTYYRRMSLEVNSRIYPPMPIIGTDRNEKNLKYQENLGNVKIQKIKLNFNKSVELTDKPLRGFQ